MVAGEPTNDSGRVASNGTLPVEANIEIGGARDDELDTVLRVMCAAFELPFEVARPIYYADPWFEPQNKRVLRVDGKIVSCLTLVPMQIGIGDAIVNMAGIAGVATLPEMRRRGYAGALLMDAVETLSVRGVPLAGLVPFDRSYYERFGWATASSVSRCLVDPKVLPAFRERLGVRPLVEQDLPELQRLYDACNRHGERTLRAIRDTTRWRTIYERVPQAHVFVSETGTIEGYLLAELRPGEAPLLADSPTRRRPPRLQLMELCARTEASRRGILGHLATRTPCDEIEYDGTAQDIEASGLLRPEWTSRFLKGDNAAVCARVEIVPGIMLRVVDLKELIVALRVGWSGFAGTLTLCVRDLFRKEIGLRETSVTISGNGAGLPAVVITERRSEEATISNCEGSERVEGDVGIWARVVVGHLSGGAACSLGALTATSPSATDLCDWLFPQRSPFLPLPDHF